MPGLVGEEAGGLVGKREDRGEMGPALARSLSPKFLLAARTSGWQSTMTDCSLAWLPKPDRKIQQVSYKQNHLTHSLRNQTSNSLTTYRCYKHRKPGVQFRWWF